MSTMPVSAPQDDADATRERRKEARLVRAAACQQRLRLATDALAAVDLLLGMNWSVGQCGKETKR